MQGKSEYTVGKGKPPVGTQFQKGESGNPKGKTTAQRELEIANAEAATRIRQRLLEVAEAKLKELSDNDLLDETLDRFVEASMLNLLKDAENRGLGTPKQSIDLESPNGTMTPRATSDAVIAALQRKHADP
jgi:hypothetical protein